MNDRIQHVVRLLDQVASVPTGVLGDQVVTRGACMDALTCGEPPELTGDESADRELAARLCSGCPVQRECLELELRWSGPHQVGVFGALPDGDRRLVYPVWRARRAQGGDQR